MPLYEYQCQACGHRFEKIQKFADPPETACPACGGAVEKLLSSPAIQFKGTGWYITDYARSGKSGDGATNKADAADKTDKSDQGGKSDGSATTSTAAAPSSAGDSGSSPASGSKPAPAAGKTE